MNKFMWGLFLTILVASICGCSSDEFVNQRSQVTYAEVHVGFFQKSMTALSKPTTRVDETDQVNLKKAFTRLDVVFIPKDKAFGAVKDTGYSFSQKNTDEDFGKLSIKLPVGSYYMVAIASKAVSSVSVSNSMIVTFPDNKVTDMAYAYQEVVLGKDGASVDGNLKRAAAKFLLKATDEKGANVKTFKISFNGKCNSEFDATKGVAVDDGNFTYAHSYDIEALNPKGLKFAVYVLPVTDTEKFTVDINLLDKNGEELKSLHFEDVSLKQNYVTTYTGKVFSTTVEGTFGISSENYISQGGDISFD